MLIQPIDTNYLFLHRHITKPDPSSFKYLPCLIAFSSTFQPFPEPIISFDLPYSPPLSRNQHRVRSRCSERLQALGYRCRYAREWLLYLTSSLIDTLAASAIRIYTYTPCTGVPHLSPRVPKVQVQYCTYITRKRGDPERFLFSRFKGVKVRAVDHFISIGNEVSWARRRLCLEMGMGLILG